MMLALVAACSAVLDWKDKVPEDASTDLPPPGGCADGSVEQVYGSDMVGCDGEATQDHAGALCATPGWHLCTYADYAARGGAIISATEERWLGACVRVFHTDAPGCPSGTACDPCSGIDMGTDEAVTWTCETTPNPILSIDHGYLGVATAASSSPRHVGCTASECVYATALNCMYPRGATCCR